MENTTENTAGQANSTETSAVSLGKMLSEARERLGLTVMDVASQIKFAPKQIEALEADDFLHLPEAAFLRGFVRSYAKILHLDAQPLLAALPQKQTAQAGSLAESTGEPFPDAHSAQRQNVVWLGATLLLIAIVVGFALWHFSTPPAQPESSQVESPVALPDDLYLNPAQLASAVAASGPLAPKQQILAVPAHPPAPIADRSQARPAQQAQAATAATTQPAPLQLSTLRLVFNGESWTEVKDRDGKILSSRANEPGSELRVKGQAPFMLVIGNASSVRLFYRDKEIDLVPHTRLYNDVASLTLE